MPQKLVPIFFYNKKLEFLEINRKWTVKATPGIEKYVYYIFTENICSARNPMQAVVFCKRINFVEQRLKFFHFEGSIIP